MEKIIDTVNDADTALEYWDMSRYGIVKTLDRLLDELRAIREKTNEVDTRKRVERLMLVLEAQLDY